MKNRENIKFYESVINRGQPSEENINEAKKVIWNNLSMKQDSVNNAIIDSNLSKSEFFFIKKSIFFRLAGAAAFAVIIAVTTFMLNKNNLFNNQHITWNQKDAITLKPSKKIMEHPKIPGLIYNTDADFRGELYNDQSTSVIKSFSGKISLHYKNPKIKPLWIYTRYYNIKITGTTLSISVTSSGAKLMLYEGSIEIWNNKLSTDIPVKLSGKVSYEYDEIHPLVYNEEIGLKTFYNNAVKPGKPPFRPTHTVSLRNGKKIKGIYLEENQNAVKIKTKEKIIWFDRNSISFIEKITD